MSARRTAAASRPRRPRNTRPRCCNDFAATETVVRPFAYLLPARFGEALATLQRHGIDVQELREDVELDIEAYAVEEVGKQQSRGWDRRDLIELHVTPRAESRRVPAGTLMVERRQPLGSLAVYLLEPRSEDGLAAWKFFDDGLKTGSDFPGAPPSPAGAAHDDRGRALAEERKHDLPITLARNSAPGVPEEEAVCSADLPSRRSWLDGEHWLQVREGKLHKVEAATGRSRPFIDPVALAKGLKRLPTIDDDTAQSIARGTFFDMDPDHKGFLFKHDDDLYYASFDGSTAVRLTNHPGHEAVSRVQPRRPLGGFHPRLRPACCGHRRPRRASADDGRHGEPAARDRRLGLLRGDLQPPLAGLLVEPRLEADRPHGIRRRGGWHSDHAQ